MSFGVHKPSPPQILWKECQKLLPMIDGAKANFLKEMGEIHTGKKRDIQFGTAVYFDFAKRFALGEDIKDLAQEVGLHHTTVYQNIKQAVMRVRLYGQ